MESLDTICKNCGQRYGRHTGVICNASSLTGFFEPEEEEEELFPGDKVTIIMGLPQRDYACIEPDVIEKLSKMPLTVKASCMGFILVEDPYEYSWPRKVLKKALKKEEEKIKEPLFKKEETESFINNSPKMYKTYNGPKIGWLLKRKTTEVENEYD